MRVRHNAYPFRSLTVPACIKSSIALVHNVRVQAEDVRCSHTLNFFSLQKTHALSIKVEKFSACAWVEVAIDRWVNLDFQGLNLLFSSRPQLVGTAATQSRDAER
jgi:hypothetical protein